MFLPSKRAVSHVLTSQGGSLVCFANQQFTLACVFQQLCHEAPPMHTTVLTHSKCVKERCRRSFIPPVVRLYYQHCFQQTALVRSATETRHVTHFSFSFAHTVQFLHPYLLFINNKLPQCLYCTYYVYTSLFLLHTFLLYCSFFTIIIVCC